MHVKAQMALQPRLHLGMLVGGVVVGDQVHSQALGRLGIDPAQDPYLAHVCRVNFDGTGLIDLTPANGSHSVAFSPDGRFYLDTYSRVDQPPVCELRRAENATLVCTVESADARELSNAGWSAPEPFVAKGRDGKTDIHGLIYRPTGFDPSKL